jgi:hypothetical protein
MVFGKPKTGTEEAVELISNDKRSAFRPTVGASESTKERWIERERETMNMRKSLEVIQWQDAATSHNRDQPGQEGGKGLGPAATDRLTYRSTR